MKLTAKGLQVGNILTVGNYEVKVVEIHGQGVHVVDLEETQDTWELFSDRIKPVVITEEWLLKFGFIETSAQEHRFELKPFVVYLWLTGVVIEIGKEFYETDNKYVHQLQNLVFALTGKELEFIL